MRPYIYGKRNLVHIINLRETVKGLARACHFLKQLVAQGGDVLIVGTKPQARPIIEGIAIQTGSHFVVDRWLGGTLTNFSTIRSRISHYEALEALVASEEAQTMSKKELSAARREQRKMERNLRGIRKMHSMPSCLILVDPRREHLAVSEAKKLGIPTVGLIDTDGDPELVDIPVPGNDDAMKSIELVVTRLGAAIEEGKSMQPGARVDALDAAKAGDSRKVAAGRVAEPPITTTVRAPQTDETNTPEQGPVAAQ